MKKLIVIPLMLTAISAPADCTKEIGAVSLKSEQSIKSALKCINDFSIHKTNAVSIEKRKIRLVNYLKDTETKVRKFTTVKSRLDEWYTADNIKYLIEQYPDDLRTVKIKGGNAGVGIQK